MCVDNNGKIMKNCEPDDAALLKWNLSKKAILDFPFKFIQNNCQNTIFLKEDSSSAYFYNTMIYAWNT